LKKLIVITGATACGKTSVSVALAQRLQTEIVSCDSRQFYKEMAIGTAKPTVNEMDGVIHHFVDSHSITDEINAGEFERLALPLINRLFLTHDNLILTGGSGLFIDAIVNGFDDMPKIEPELRLQLNNTFKSKGIEPLFAQLQSLDPTYANSMDSKNPKRIIRALEICLSGPKTYSELRTGQKAHRDFEVQKIVLDRPREELYARINKRVDLMIAEGLEQEVRSLIPFRHLSSLQTVGYRELFEFFDDEITLDRAIELIKQNSRRYAKRQLTWFRRDSNYNWINADDSNALYSLIEG
tara:strand:+ start:72100 stop:72990 length:891 start_codon:yes stop_codon:yes gene_type:complete